MAVAVEQNRIRAGYPAGPEVLIEVGLADVRRDSTAGGIDSQQLLGLATVDDNFVVVDPAVAEGVGKLDQAGSAGAARTHTHQCVAFHETDVLAVR